MEKTKTSSITHVYCRKCHKAYNIYQNPADAKWELLGEEDKDEIRRKGKLLEGVFSHSCIESYLAITGSNGDGDEDIDEELGLYENLEQAIKTHLIAFPCDANSRDNPLTNNLLGKLRISNTKIVLLNSIELKGGANKDES